MFAKYQREAIKRGEVTLGLEELDIELNELQQFEAAIDHLDKSFGLKLDPGLIDSQVMTPELCTDHGLALLNATSCG